MKFEELKNLPRISRNGEKSLIGVWDKANEDGDENLVLLCEYAMLHQDYKALNFDRCLGYFHSAVKNLKENNLTWKERFFDYLTEEDLELELFRRKNLAPNQRKKANTGTVSFLKLYKGK